MPPGCHSGLAGLFTNNGVRARPRPLVASEVGEERGPGLARVSRVPLQEGQGGGWHRRSATPRARARRGRRQGAAEAAAPAGGGCAPATAGYWPRARWAGGAGARGGVGGAVTAEGWRGPRVRGCGSAGVSPGCVCSCLAPEFVSLHRDVGVCHPEGCLRSRERHGPRTSGGQLSGARRGPGPRRSAPLPARPPGTLRRVLRPLRARPACRPSCPRPAAGRLPLRSHRPACRHRRPGGPPLVWGFSQPAPRPTPGRSSALAVTSPAAPRIARAQRPGGPGGRPHPGSPGSAWGGGGVGPGDRGPAAADGGRPQRAVRAAETRRAASTPPLALEGRVQSLHGTPPLTQGSRSPRNGAQLGAYTRPGDVRDLGGRTPSAF